MKEAKDARYTNGHLFTTISVSGMTMCYACNKSITAKEALICPSELPRLTVVFPADPVTALQRLSAGELQGSLCPPEPLSVTLTPSPHAPEARGVGGGRENMAVGGGEGDGSPGSCCPLGSPPFSEQLLRVGGTNWRSSRNVGGAGGKLWALQLVLPIFWRDCRVPPAPPCGLMSPEIPESAVESGCGAEQDGGDCGRNVCAGIRA